MSESDFSTSLFKDRFLETEMDEESHTYRVKNNTGYISVTTLIGKYCQPFDKEDAVKRASKKKEHKGKTEKQILTEWDEKAHNASSNGKGFHGFAENFLLSGNSIDQVVPDSKEKEYFVNFYKDFLFDKEVIYLEKILYNEYYKVVGTIDALVYCPTHNILYFIDWKTNEKISVTNKWQNFKPPINRYEQCSKEIYTLQISLYRWIIEKEILNINSPPTMKNLLVHFSKLNSNYQVHELNYYKFSVVQLLEDFKKGTTL